MADKNTISDDRIEQIVGNLLRVAVIISGAVVLVGGVIYLVRHGAQMPDYGVFAGIPKDLRSLGDVIKVAENIRGAGIIQLGILLLIATPVARVLFSVAAFLMQRDYMYTAFTLIVLTVLLLSITGLIA